MRYSFFAAAVQFRIRIDILSLSGKNGKLDQVGVFSRAGLLFWRWTRRTPFYHDDADNGIFSDAYSIYLQFGCYDRQRNRIAKF
jgi:hypothetical protein